MPLSFFRSANVGQIENKYTYCNYFTIKYDFVDLQHTIEFQHLYIIKSIYQVSLKSVILFLWI